MPWLTQLDNPVSFYIITVMPKQVDIPAQRAMITKAAIAVINETGLERTRLRDVARAASVTTGSVMHYFDNKEAVLEAALEEIVRRTLARMESATDSATRGDLSVFMRRVCHYLPIDKAGRAEWRVWLAFWGRAISDERLRVVHHQHYTAIVDQMVVLLQTLNTKASKMPLKQIRKCADALIAAIDGVGTRANAGAGSVAGKTSKRNASPIIDADADSLHQSSE